MSFNDPFANMGDEEEKSEKPRPRPTPANKFDQPLEVTRRDVYRATGTGKSVMHGQLYQLTTRLPLEVVEEIRQWAADLGMTQQDVQRYCFYRGLQALSNGERPEFEEVVIRRKLKPPTPEEPAA
jgi:hypothetical protein